MVYFELSKDKVELEIKIELESQILIWKIMKNSILFNAAVCTYNLMWLGHPELHLLPTSCIKWEAPALELYMFHKN